MINPRRVEIGSDEEKKLVAVAKMLEAVSPNGYRYEVEVTYFDYGQDWLWTTIIRHDDNKDYNVQVLNPKEWEHIITAETITDLCVITEHITKDKYFGDK